MKISMFSAPTPRRDPIALRNRRSMQFNFFQSQGRRCHDSVTCGGSPEVSSTAFDAQPPDLPPVCLVDTGFAVLCQLAPHRRPHHPVLVHRLAPLIHASFRPRLATTPLRFSSPSPPPGWAGDFHPQAVEHVRHTKLKPPILSEAQNNCT